MLFKNAFVFRTELRQFVFGGFHTENGRFADVFSGETQEDGRDLEGTYVIPGLVDAHTHGAVGADFSDGDLEGLTRMGTYLAENGITSFAPTSMTLPYGQLSAAFATALALKKEWPGNCARCAGIHMEGPFFSEKKKGAQNAAYLRLPDFEAFRGLYDGCEGLIRIVDAAPELPGAAEFAGKAAGLCTVSAAHTDTSYQEAAAFYDAGASHLTHLFNAMPPLHHRNPGVIGAAAERENVTAELICDGQHVHPSAVRIAFSLFPDRICLISDALRCCGMPDGTYELGGQNVRLKGGIARLEDGTIAGAASNLYQDMCNAISFGIPAAQAIIAATLRPAEVLGVSEDTGSVSTGKYADFVVCDKDLALREVYLDGIKIV